MSAPVVMTTALATRFRRARLATDDAVLVDRRALAADPRMIACDGWLVLVAQPTDDVGGLLVYVDLTDAATRWHRYYCGEERNDNRTALGKGLVGWAISRERVRMLRADVERWQKASDTETTS